MATKVRVSIFVSVLLLVLSTLYAFSFGNDDQVIHYGVGAIRNLSGVRRNSQIPDCSEMGSKSQCSQNAKCRWCRSDALDDMCFSKAEAWRLPQQRLNMVYGVSHRQEESETCLVIEARKTKEELRMAYLTSIQDYKWSAKEWGRQEACNKRLKWGVTSNSVAFAV